MFSAKLLMLEQILKQTKKYKKTKKNFQKNQKSIQCFLGKTKCYEEIQKK